jgi:hypothetical protein
MSLASALAQYAESAMGLPASRAFLVVPEGISLASSSSRVDDVPVISRFYGITIAMYHREHGLPHFHAGYGDDMASIEIGTGRVRGDLPPQVRAKVLEWLDRHRGDLLDNWNRARSQRPLRRVAPLE